MVAVLHPTGNENVRNLLLALAEEDLLAKYYTTLATFDTGSAAVLSKMPFLSEFKRRKYPENLKRFTTCRPTRELARLLSIRMGAKWVYQHEKGWACMDFVIRALDNAVSKSGIHPGLQALYAFEDCALQSFKAASASSLKCIYEHPVGYWRFVRRLMIEEKDREPEWAAAIQGLDDSTEKVMRKDEELSLADLVIVPSSFSRDSLNEFPGNLAEVKVLPYGAPTASGMPVSRKGRNGTALRVLFVGGLSQMKGLAYLFRAVEMLGDSVDLTLIGRKPACRVRSLEQALAAARWIESLPHAKILEQMASHDVLVLPSLSEGFGMVITEALSQGLPVITTPHTCGPDILTQGEDGYIVPIRDPESIAEKLDLLHRDRERLAAMSHAARKKADSLTWESYRQSVAAIVRDALEVE